RHGLAGGVHDEPGEVDPARRLGRAQIDVLAQLGVSTILLGGIYALIAVGLTLIFGIMRVVNFAHGEFLMLGMYVAFWAYSLWTLDPYFVLFVSIPLFFGIGVLTYVLVMRGVIHASHNVQIFTTVGLSTALQNAALVAWTGDYRTVRPWHSAVVIRALGMAFHLSQVVAFVLGGLGDMLGAMLGSLIVAAVEVVGSYFFGVAWKEVFYFVLFIAVLVLRPAGLFGQRGAETLGV